MRSTIPCASRNSLRWKPSRQLLADGALDDARPGEADEAPGSAMFTSPRSAKLAATPPVVGCRSTLMNGSLASCEALERRDASWPSA